MKMMAKVGAGHSDSESMFLKRFCNSELTMEERCVFRFYMEAHDFSRVRLHYEFHNHSCSTKDMQNRRKDLCSGRGKEGGFFLPEERMNQGSRRLLSGSLHVSFALSAKNAGISGRPAFRKIMFVNSYKNV